MAGRRYPADSRTMSRARADLTQGITMFQMEPFCDGSGATVGKQTYECDWSKLPLPADKSRPIDQFDAEWMIQRLVEVARGNGGLFVVSSVGDEEPCAPYQIEGKVNGGVKWARDKMRPDI